MANFSTLLKNRNFVLYSVGQAFSQFGDRLVQIVLIGFVYKRWPGSTFMLAKLFFFTVVPSFFISPIAGVYIDRWNKKYVMIASDMFRAMAILCIPLFFIHGESIVPIYIIIFFVFASACFFLPARLSVIPGLIPKEELLLANSASSITWVISGIAGFSFGGVLAEWIGIKNSLYINSLVYVFSALSFLSLVYYIKNKNRSAKPEPPRQIEAILKKSFLHDLKEGLKTLFFNRKMRFVAYIFFIVSSMFGAIYVVSVVFIQEALGSMTKDVGILGMSLFAGLLLGSYIYGRIGQGLPKAKVIFISLFLIGIFIDAFAIGLKTFRSFWLGGLSASLVGFFIAPIYVIANTIIHESIESNLRGRIFSSIGIVMNLGFLFCMFIASMLAEYIDKFWILIACGSGLLLFGIISILAGFLKRFTSS
ncbi:MAG: MFS transporter [Candidatus Omnitrophota bacterium]|nr:MAG: MFS transporter [Candidatus Omnitrophota bacterium]